MDVEYGDPDLEKLVRNANSNGGFSREVVKAYRKRIQGLIAATDERDIRAMKSWRFEKLKGNRSHQHSIRLNDQMRLILEIRKANPKNKIIVVAIEDYH